MKKMGVVICLVALTSCTAAVKLIYGVKSPKPRTTSYVQKHSQKHELSHFPHYTLTYEGFCNLFSNSQNLGVQSSINQVVVFNQDGHLVTLRDSMSCSSQFMDLIRGYQDSTLTKQHSHVYFSDVFCDTLRPLNEEANPLTFSGDKHLFVITWASFVGKLNTTNTKLWADSISEIVANGQAEAIFVNLDLKEAWDIDIE